jgi:hypothetical protein
MSRRSPALRRVRRAEHRRIRPARVTWRLLGSRTPDGAAPNGTRRRDAARYEACGGRAAGSARPPALANATHAVALGRARRRERWAALLRVAHGEIGVFRFVSGIGGRRGVTFHQGGSHGRITDDARPSTAADRLEYSVPRRAGWQPNLHFDVGIRRGFRVAATRQ